MAHQETTQTTRGDYVFYASLVGIFAAGTAWSLLKEGGHTFRMAGGGFNWDTLGIFVAAGMTLALYSFLYKDNPFFKAAEHIYVGVGLGYQIVYIAWFAYLKPDLYKPLVRYWIRDNVPGRPDYLLIVPLVLGLFLLARFIPKLAWLSRWSFAFIVGYGSGIVIPATMKAYLMKQIYPTIGSLAPVGANGQLALGDPHAWINPAQTLVILLGVVSVLIYFFFSLEHKGAVGKISRLGVWFLMVSFGASFGYTVMGRMALFVERIFFLLGTWLKIHLT